MRAVIIKHETERGRGWTWRMLICSLHRNLTYLLICLFDKFYTVDIASEKTEAQSAWEPL